ncbi:hypothetical protein NLX83_13210 [Allokutzneria sp. A3M-2-11 16]|uniref:hypothetical protein n=1 Tax=Allokutzneria sp. A3M-2-11 16 TaxID=2962043 RepID=UPI0020B71841|nr:hypothetical protein [Allokutzneria sp. A3M-2-11 16]MCP3800218.1 hypothetical protein [Allokutzneria sp. A3M-2-11 16]
MTTTADTAKAFTDRFTADSTSALWKTSVTSARLDGRAVLVVTSLTKTDKATAVKVCDAAFVTAKSTVPDLVSVTVRTATDNSIAWANTMRGDTACKS